MMIRAAGARRSISRCCSWCGCWRVDALYWPTPHAVHHSADLLDARDPSCCRDDNHALPPSLTLSNPRPLAPPSRAHAISRVTCPRSPMQRTTSRVPEQTDPRRTTFERRPRQLTPPPPPPAMESITSEVRRPTRSPERRRRCFFLRGSLVGMIDLFARATAADER